MVVSHSLVPRLHCPALFSLWKNTGQSAKNAEAGNEAKFATLVPTLPQVNPFVMLVDNSTLPC